MTFRLVTIANDLAPVEAHLLKNLLETFDIEAYVIDESVTSLNPLFSTAMGGVRLQVCGDQAEQALAVMRTQWNNRSEEEGDAGEGPGPCPGCGSREIAPARKSLLAAVRALFHPGPRTIMEEEFRCRRCGTQWIEMEDDGPAAEAGGEEE